MIMVDLVRAWEEKLKLASSLEDKLDRRELMEARRDFHARRLPRPCGLTVHTGLGCKFGCLYCYIYDMEFPRIPKPYPLTGLQLAYALALNPSAALGNNGTLMAFGSVTEPFMEETTDRALEYLEVVARELENPIQFSTKARLDGGLVARLGSIPNRLSALVTIVTTSFHKMLEPGAPDPDERFQTITALSRRGVHTCLFLRPILPGLGEEEIKGILVRALDSGAAGVVLGSMRVTEGIIRRLKVAGYPHMDEIMGRVPGAIKPGVQVTLRTSDLKMRCARFAEELGLKTYASACAANIEAHGVGCAACKLGPCGDTGKIPDVDEHGLMELSANYGINVKIVAINDFEIILNASGPDMRIAQFREFVKSICKRRVIIKR